MALHKVEQIAATTFLFCFRSAPLQIILTSYFIYLELGYAVFAALGVIVVALPLNIIAGGISRKFQLEQMKNKDQRVKLMNEILAGMKVLKLYGWEESFMNQVLPLEPESMNRMITFLPVVADFEYSK